MVNKTKEYQNFVEKLKEEVCRLTKGTDVMVVFEHAEDNFMEDLLLVESDREKGKHIQRFHVEELYQDLMSGEVTMEELFKNVTEILDYCREVEKISPLDQIDDYEKICNNLIVRPLNYDNHAEQLKEGIYDRIGDVALVLYVSFGTIKGMYISSMVPFHVISGWKKEKKEVMEAALKNTHLLFPPRALNIFGVLSGDMELNCAFMEQNELPEEVKGTFGIFVSNKNMINGAVSVFLPGVAKKLGELLDSDFYIAFTSIHEAAIHKIGTMAVEAIRESLMYMKMENDSEDEFLSEKVYRYSREKDIIEVL